MPQAPMIIPIIIAGLVLGSVLVSEKHTLSKKKLLGVSALSGILNLGNAYLVYQLLPPPTFNRTGGQFSQFSQFRAAAAASSESSFYVSSFIVGFLLVLAVVGIALTYAKFKSHKAGEEEVEETDLEDEEPNLDEENNA